MEKCGINMRRTLKETVYDAVMLLWEDMKAVKWAIMLIIAYFVVGKNYLYSLCPMVVITGLPCPGCGLTRAGFLLLRGDFAQAFLLHPFIYLIVGYAGFFCWNRYICKRRMGEGLKLLFSLLLVFMILYYIWRMVKDFPGKPPMSYYEGNLLRGVWNRLGYF